MKKYKSWKSVVNSRNRRVLAFRKKGYSYADIGRIMGMSRQLVYHICQPVDKFKVKGLDK